MFREVCRFQGQGIKAGILVVLPLYSPHQLGLDTCRFITSPFYDHQSCHVPSYDRRKFKKAARHQQEWMVAANLHYDNRDHSLRYLVGEQRL